VHGYISTKDSTGRERLSRLFSQARFLLLPSRAECNANVFAEACAFGVPVLATQTGGVSTTVRDGVNGRTFALAAPPAVYADYIEDMLAAPIAYRELATGAYEEYRNRLNWGVAAATVMRLLEQCVQAREQGAPRAAAALHTGASTCAG
jgi:glycosyltransferase involved in cell wall biosynthesis